MTTPHDRVRAVQNALNDLREGDLEAVLDLDRFVKDYPNYTHYCVARHDDPDYVRDQVDPADGYQYSDEHVRYFGSGDALRGISGHVLGRIWEFHLGDIIEAGGLERRPPGPTPIFARLLREARFDPSGGGPVTPSS
jgi:hypothetical protein